MSYPHNPYGQPPAYGYAAPNPYPAYPGAPPQAAPGHAPPHAAPGYAAPPQSSPYGAQPAPTSAAAPAGHNRDPRNSATQQAAAGQPPSYLPPTTYQPSTVPEAPRKKALLVGCGYPGTSAELKGCINDVKCLEYMLTTRFGFRPEQIVKLRDDVYHPDFSSTRANIFRGIQWLLTDQRPGDSLFFSFSGHGSQKRAIYGDEDDGLDETILPTDYKYAGQITDNELNAALVRPLAPGVTMHCITDACHSGTGLDLQYQTEVDAYSRFYWKADRPGYIYKGTAGGTVFQFSACKDHQVAQDTKKMSGTAYTGAATFSFIQAVERGGVHQSYGSVLSQMMHALRAQSQAPISGGGILSQLLMGPVPSSHQTPILCCDKAVDINNTRLNI